jgi:hypothetical protein
VRTLVYGLGESGVAARALAGRGEDVLAADDRRDERLRETPAALGGLSCSGPAILG